MQIIEQSYEILWETPNLIEMVEEAGRQCYESTDKICEGSAEKFISNIIKRGHESPLEHAVISVRLNTSRAILAEITRHRLASYSVSSTRYINSKNKGFKVVRPFYISKEIMEHCVPGIKDRRWLLKACKDSEIDFKIHNTWLSAQEDSEQSYYGLLELGKTPQEARSVLTNDFYTTIVMTANCREWRHIFKLRCDKKHAHPDIVNLFMPLFDELNKKYPCIFDKNLITE